MDSQDAIKRKRKKTKKRKEKHLHEDGKINVYYTDNPVNEIQFENFIDYKRSADGLPNCCECLKSGNDRKKNGKNRKKKEVVCDEIPEKKRKKKEIIVCKDIETEIELTQECNNEMMKNRGFQDDIYLSVRKKKKKKIKSFPELDTNSTTENTVNLKHNSGLLQSTEMFNNSPILKEQEINSTGTHGGEYTRNSERCKKAKKRSKVKERKYIVDAMENGKLNNVNDKNLIKDKINMKISEIDVMENREKKVSIYFFSKFLIYDIITDTKCCFS